MKLEKVTLVVGALAIAGVLVVLLTPQSMCIDANTDNIVITKVKLDIREIYALTMAIRKKDGSFPTADKWNKYMFAQLKKIPQDPWGREYIYKTLNDQKQFRIISYGRDGNKGGKGLDMDWFYENTGKIIWILKRR